MHRKGIGSGCLICLLVTLIGLSGCGIEAETGSQKSAIAASDAGLTLATPGRALVDPQVEETLETTVVASADPAAESNAEPAETSAATKDIPKIDDLKQSATGSSPATTRTGEDWPRFLGPRDTGISGETGLLTEWPAEGPPLVWEKRVGTGYSAPSVRGNLLVLHHRIRNFEVIDAFEADSGKQLWTYKYPSSFSDPYGYNNGPRCTPLLTEDRCYTFGAEGMLVCLELKTGNKIWSRETAAEWDIPQAFFGVGSSPVLEGNLLIVMVGAHPKSGVVAFDAATGKTVWESVGKSAIKFPRSGYPLDDKLASYSSLLGATFHGERHILALMRDGLVSLDPKDGRIRFTYFFRSRLNDSVNAARPVVVDDQIFLSAAYNTGAALLKVHPDGNGVDEVWRNRSLDTHWSTTIHHEGYLYGFSGRHEPEGTLRCVDIKTGEVVWETEGAGPDVKASPKDGLGDVASKYYGRGSAILAEGKFIVLGERGMLALVEASPKAFHEICRFKFPQMNYPSWAAPILSRKRLYLRCEDHMICIDLAKP